MATLSQWVEGARPRTLPAAVAPVLVGTGAAFALSRANAAVRPARAARRRWRCRSASTTPTTTPTGSAAPTTPGSGRCGWSGTARHRRPTSSWRRSFVLRRRGRGRARPGGAERGLVDAARRRGLASWPPGTTPAASGPTATAGSARCSCSSSSGWSPRSARCTPRPLPLDLAGWAGAVGIGALASRDPRGQQPARHPHRRRQRQAHPGRAPGRPRHPGPLRRPARRRRGRRGGRGLRPRHRPCWRWRRSGSPGPC